MSTLRLTNGSISVRGQKQKGDGYVGVALFPVRQVPDLPLRTKVPRLISLSRVSVKAGRT